MWVFFFGEFCAIPPLTLVSLSRRDPYGTAARQKVKRGRVSLPKVQRWWCHRRFAVMETSLTQRSRGTTGASRKDRNVVVVSYIGKYLWYICFIPMYIRYYGRSITLWCLWGRTVCHYVRQIRGNDRKSPSWIKSGHIWSTPKYPLFWTIQSHTSHIQQLFRRKNVPCHERRLQGNEAKKSIAV